ncbi:MAG: hypothetical protein Kow0098_24970 [Ignavibacteriaceae bacterium]
MSKKRFEVEISVNLDRLLNQEDTDGDKKITIEDKGKERFTLIDIMGNQYEICGTYQLSVLLQELILAKEDGKSIATIQFERIFTPPVEKASYMIKNYFWDGLTRRIDEDNLAKALIDSKTTSSVNYLYLPASDEFAFQYYKSIEKRKPELNLSVKKLPDQIDEKEYSRLNKNPGLLSLALKKNKNGNITGVPFVVPGGRFNEMYGWDSYFESLGLLQDNRVDLAIAMAENFFYQIEHYGKILNANRSYYLNRSQPPFLSSLIRAILNFKKNPGKKWLTRALNCLIKEYETIWMGKERLTETGLSRFYGSGSGMPPETEPTHFDSVLVHYAPKYGLTLEEFRNKYLNNELKDEELEEYFMHDRSMRESGHDTSYRLEGVAAHLVTVDLNALLYKYETDIAHLIRKYFRDVFVYNDKRYKSTDWIKRAARRKKIINKLMWDDQRGFYFDFNFVNNEKHIYESATTFYPLWAGIPTKKQAQKLVKHALKKLEAPGGILASTEESRGAVSENRPPRQWDYPNGWAPHQIIAWEGLTNYGFKKDVQRLAYKWLYTILRNYVDYNGTIPEKYDVVNRTHKVFAEYGNVGTEFSYLTKEGFGWMNASFQVGLTYLSKSLRKKLNQLIPPEWIF